MVKYCILSPTTEIDPRMSSEKLRAFTKEWSWVATNTDKHRWKWFEHQEDADAFIAKLEMDEATSFGVEVTADYF